MSQNPVVVHTFSLQVSPTWLVAHASDTISGRLGQLNNSSFLIRRISAK